MSIKHSGIIDLFFETAKRYPQNQAVEDYTASEPRLFTYENLEGSVRDFGAFLRQRSTGSPFIVSLLPAGYNYILSSLSSLYARKVVVVLHDNYTTCQVEKCLSTLQDPLVLTTESKWESLTGIRHSNVYFMHESVRLKEQTLELNEEESVPESLHGVVYCFFTSGSTGAPKAVLVTDDAVLNGIKALIGSDESAFTSSMRGLMGVSNSFIASLSDIWPVFYTGGTLVIPPLQIKLDMERFRPWLTTQQVSSATFATPVLELLLQKDVEKLTTLKWVSFGGARINPNRIQVKEAHFDTYHLYGGTEFYIGAIGRIPKGTETVSATVGTPIPNLKIYILDDDQNLILSPGIRGEVYLAGIGIMRGYHNQPELTKKVLLDNPFDSNMSPMYKSGDSGYWSEDGELFIVGRMDDQVKIHGMRLELGEVETALSNFPGISQVAVIAKEIEENKQLHAFCTLKEGATEPNDSKKVEAFLLERLQRHAIPSTISFLEDLPRTPTGKIDRVMLWDFDTNLAESKKSEPTSEVPESDQMKTVRCIWEQTLGLCPSQLKGTDNFFYKGGNSILVFKAMDLLRKMMPECHQLSPMLLFQFPVLQDFVKALEKDGKGETPDSEPNQIDFEQEAQLPTDFPISNADQKESPSGILITGATGFLGPFLLMEALKQYTENDVLCIIRAKTDEEAKGRLDAIFDKYSIHSHLIHERITCIAGDLTQPKFGLLDSQYELLLTKIGVVFHSAAEVSFMKKYEQLRDSTVAMTRNILRFVLEGSMDFHFMSTIGVFDGAYSDSIPYVAVEGSLPPEVDPRRMTNAYFQSKWVAEKLVWAGCERGLRASIYRIAQVGADRATSTVNRTDAIAGFIVACKKMGCYPRVELKLPYVEAEATRTIIYLSQRNWAEGAKTPRVFHIVGKEVGLDDFFRGKTKLATCDLLAWERDFEAMLVDGPKSEDDINAWLFLQMLKQAEDQHSSNQRSLMRSISFSTAETEKLAGNFLWGPILPSYYADLLTQDTSCENGIGDAEVET